MGITPYDLPLDADLTLQTNDNYLFTYTRVGQGASFSAHKPNIGSGGSGGSSRVSSVNAQHGGIGGGGGGGYYNYTGRGGQGAGIVEVLS